MKRPAESPLVGAPCSVPIPPCDQVQAEPSHGGRRQQHCSPSRRRYYLRRLCLIGLSSRLSCAFGPIAPPRRAHALRGSSKSLAQLESIGASIQFGSTSLQRRCLRSQLNQHDVTGVKSVISSTQSWISRLRAAPSAPGGKLAQQELPFTTTRTAEVSNGDPQDYIAPQKTSKKESLTFLGALFSLAIVLVLASGYGTGDEGSTTLGAMSTPGGADGSRVVDLERLRDNIIDATLPMTASDAFSVAFGEGFAGIAGGFISAVLSAGVASVLKSLSLKSPGFRKDRVVDAVAPVEASLSLAGTSSSNSASRLGNEAVASGDFFLTRAAALPLLEATGVSSTLATVASVIVATIPYEIVKYSQRQQSMKREEEKRLQVLLKEQNALTEWPWVAFSKFVASRTPQSVDLQSLTPVLQDSEMKLDLVEVFADVTKWLGYAVLVENYGGTLAWSGLTGTFPYAENFLFGAIANLSSQVYADILYARFGFAGEDKQRAVLSRSLEEWVTLYVSSCVTGATLFGVYEAAQIPAKVLTSALFSGGVEGCFGSTDYNLCVESFLFNGMSPPGPSLEAQVRAILTTLASLWNRLGLDEFLSL